MRRDLKLSEFKIENPFGAKLAKMINIERDPELTDEEYKDIQKEIEFQFQRKVCYKIYGMIRGIKSQLGTDVYKDFFKFGTPADDISTYSEVEKNFYVHLFPTNKLRS